jgi:hypothetical protein
VSSELKKQIQQARLAKKMTQAQLANVRLLSPLLKPRSTPQLWSQEDTCLNEVCLRSL